MGCDIHLYGEKKDENGEYEICWEDESHNRQYAMFAFLAGVRNYGAITPISEPRGIPKDSATRNNANYYDSEDDYLCYPSSKYEYDAFFDDCHSRSWLSIEELKKYDYDQIVEDRRCTIGSNGAATCEKGKGKFMTLREYLDGWLFDIIEECEKVGAERIVFAFDN